VTDEAHLGDLLLRWEELREQGQPATAEELCRDCPELLPQLQEQVRALESLGPVLAAALGPPLPPLREVVADLAAAPAPPGYEIVGELGRGGMGVVYKARQTVLNRFVALKMVLAGPDAGPGRSDRVLAEAEAVARLSHPNIVQVYEAGEAHGRPYFSMEFVQGGSLAGRLAGRQHAARASAILIEQLARAVHAAHERGIVHRDLKPANVLLTADGQPKITDFGLAKLLDGGEVTPSGDVLGTPGYMAPEQATAGARVGPATDVYALGAILFEMLTGRPPFKGPTSVDTILQVRMLDPVSPSRLRPRLPRDLETICLKCLRKDPGQRYASAADLADDLRAYLGGEPIRARREPIRARAVRWVRRRPALTLLAAVVAAALVAFAVSWSAGPVVVGAVAELVLLAAAGWLSFQAQAALRDGRRRHREVERSVERLHLVLEMTRRLVSSSDLNVVLRLLSVYATRLADAESATLYLIDRERGELWSRVLLNERLERIRLPLGVGIAGVVAATGETLNIPDAYADKRFHPEVDQFSGFRTRSLLTLPLLGRGGGILGVFQLVNKRGGPFTDEDTEIIGLLRESAAVAVENALGAGGNGAAPAQDRMPPGMV
jgi:serine/threonine-protein kinase